MKKIHFYSLHELKQNIKENFVMNATIKYKKRRCDKKTKFSFIFFWEGGGVRNFPCLSVYFVLITKDYKNMIGFYIFLFNNTIIYL